MAVDKRGHVFDLDPVGAMDLVLLICIRRLTTMQ